MKHIDSKGKQAKLKSPTQLQDLLEVTVLELERLDALIGSPEGAAEPDVELREKLRIVKTVLEQGGHFSGVNRKAQLKPLKWSTDEEGKPFCVEALLILKHGGVLTHAGRDQAHQLGLNYRMVMYPNQVGSPVWCLAATMRI